jgi:RimJ/RimL family protein N-acetyltransferase
LQILTKSADEPPQRLFEPPGKPNGARLMSALKNIKRSWLPSPAAKEVPSQTIETFARGIFKEAVAYGFTRVDLVRLINGLMDLCANHGQSPAAADKKNQKQPFPELPAGRGFPLEGARIRIDRFQPATDTELLEAWLSDEYGRHFLISSATAQLLDIDALTHKATNHIGLIRMKDGRPVGAVAFLDHQSEHRRAELRKLIGEPSVRGQGLAEEATRLWIAHGITNLGLEKIYVSTLQTHIRNIKLNEDIGFSVEGILHNEVLIDGKRHDVLRMGLTVNSQGHQ